MSTVVTISKAQARAIMDALRPLVQQTLNPADPVDRVRLLELVNSGQLKLHISQVLTAGDLQIYVCEVDPTTKEPNILAVFSGEGGGLIAKPDGVQCN